MAFFPSSPPPPLPAFSAIPTQMNYVPSHFVPRSASAGTELKPRHTPGEGTGRNPLEALFLSNLCAVPQKLSRKKTPRLSRQNFSPKLALKEATRSSRMKVFEAEYSKQRETGFWVNEHQNVNLSFKATFKKLS